MPPPHAFVHFAQPEVACRTAAAGSELILRARPAYCGSHRRGARHQGAEPFHFAGSRVEVGNLWPPAAFTVAWRDPAAPGGLDLRGRPARRDRDAAFAFLGSHCCAATSSSSSPSLTLPRSCRSRTTTRSSSGSRPRPCCTTARRPTMFTSPCRPALPGTS
ncbi:probable RNA-dependent RNA polymerase SHL2 [Panicum virgatum]|uniref:probable RNA-dependent RNA polymerase SHL2 n=1 Tax=Panicum virgatum TaxID=38727 RepID=UPI0019D67508|nr:probable RNA-dependent RNA polymerase SHL2 [Panicum virgatum]